MTPAEIVTMIAAITSAMTAAAGLLVAVRQLALQTKTHELVNSLSARRVRSAKADSRRLGQAEGRALGAIPPQVPAPGADSGSSAPTAVAPAETSPTPQAP